MSNAAFVGSGSYTVTPSNTQDLPYPGSVIQVTVGGSLKITGMNGMVDTWVLPDGAQLPILVRRVWADSTATGIHGILP